MTMLRRLSWKRRMTTGEDGFALLYSLLIILVITGLSTAVLGVIVNQARPNELARKRQATLDSAEAGLQSAINRLRASTVTGIGTKGNIGQLPQCSGANNYATVSGSVDGLSDNFVANVYYLDSGHNPSGMTLATISAAALPCNPINSTPAYAYITSAGSAPAIAPAPGAAANAQTGNRTLHAIYQFTTTNTNIAGGRIQEAPQPLCWDTAGPAKITAPQAGQPVWLEACQPTPYAPQSWIYEPNLTIQWTGDPTTNLCIGTASGPNTYPQAAVLQTCAGAPTPPAVGSAPAGQPVPYGTTATPNYNNTLGYLSNAEQAQEWGFNDNGHFAGAANNGDVTGQCLGTSVDSTGALPSADMPLMYVGCYGSTASSSQPNQAYNPDASAGAGAATGFTTGFPTPTGQLVNYQEFGRCYDLTGKSVTASYDITYPCKQSPDPNLVSFNQRWTFTAASGTNYGTLSTNQNMNTSNPPAYYCLTQQGYGGSTAIAVISTPCNGNAAAGGGLGAGDQLATQLWTLTGNIVGDYADSDQIRTNVSGTTYCLSLASVNAMSPSPASKDKFYSEPVLEPCNAGGITLNREKWNAPAGGQRSSLLGLMEDTDH